MENMMKNWKRYLNEQGGSEQYQLFSDMDGVLVNFEGGVLEYMNEKMQEIAENKEKYNLDDFKLGWIIGNFEPSIVNTNLFEISIKKYSKGEFEKEHVHKIADEITIIVAGKVLMNGVEYEQNDIILVEKEESTDFKVLTDTITVVIKTPSVPGDKYNL